MIEVSNSAEKKQRFIELRAYEMMLSVMLCTTVAIIFQKMLMKVNVKYALHEFGVLEHSTE